MRTLGAILRLVMDLRKDNFGGADPPKAMLSSPESLASLDFSAEALEEGEMMGWCGDVPDSTHGVGIWIDLVAVDQVRPDRTGK